VAKMAAKARRKRKAMMAAGRAATKVQLVRGWVEHDDSRGVAGRVEHLFDAVRNPKTGRPNSNAEAARMTLGTLSEEEVENIRTSKGLSPPRFLRRN
jgi:hypothetical protein